MAPKAALAALGSGGPNHQAASTTDDDASSPYDIPDRYENLDELAATSDAPLDDIRSGEQQQQQQPHTSPSPPRDDDDDDTAKAAHPASRLATQLYTLSYLVLFAILGTLARVGLAHLTTYPGAPTSSFPTLWANVGGSLVMGFLVEDRKLFRHEWGRRAAAASSSYDAVLRRRRAGSAASVDLAAAKRAHLAAKKTIPLYIGLATGFCGSFTSFSTFVRDVFLALANDMASPATAAPSPRPAGDSVMAVLGVVIQTVGLSLAAYRAGIHLGAALEPYTPSVPPRARRALDRLAVLLGWACWLGAVLLAVFPPRERWRGTVLFALVFAPLGCLARFYLAVLLNARRPSFPLGTFAANMLGTAILGAAWDVAHSAGAGGGGGGGGVLGCQLLQGVEDGFCGCLTTVSTWVSELSSLRRRSAYVYGVVSVALATALMVVIMGSLRWTQGFAPLQCHP